MESRDTDGPQPRLRAGQAFAPEATVGRPEVQGFVGALHGNRASQGVFNTTGRFSGGAQQFADTVATRVVLIDGARLTRLMIRYRVESRSSRPTRSSRSTRTSSSRPAGAPARAPS
ncbi:restriction endonuclease [Pseudactinotalea terrae]|uniref:restriction endonuclease n=1 Tax=Pseudactinotalea terrae TaxID=1743262 RepID=UPI0030C87BD1